MLGFRRHVGVVLTTWELGMKRRDFIKVIAGSAAVWPMTVLAQQPAKMKRVGVLVAIADGPEGQSRLRAFKKGLQDLGWVEGQNVLFDVLFAAGEAERSRQYATELISHEPDVILANGSAGIAALQQQTKTIPIVF